MNSDIKRGAADVSPSKVYTVCSDVLFQQVNGEVVLLSMDSGKYFGLSEVASRMWHLIHSVGDLDAVLAILLEEYDVPEDELREDVSDFAEQLIAAGLLEEENR